MISFGKGFHNMKQEIDNIRCLSLVSVFPLIITVVSVLISHVDNQDSKHVPCRVRFDHDQDTSYSTAESR